MPPRRPVTVMERAMRLLSMRAHTSCELRQKLLRAGFSATEVDPVISECEKRHYLDDRMFAEDCASLWMERGRGARSIRLKLRQKGIPPELAAAALADTGEQETEAACRAVDGKMPSLLREKDPRKRRAKTLRFLAARGFSGVALSAAMKRLAEAEKAADIPGGDDILPPEE